MAWRKKLFINLSGPALMYLYCILLLEARLDEVLGDLLGLPVKPGALDVPPIMRRADHTTLWTALLLRMVQLPYQAVIQPDRMLSMMYLKKFVGLRGQY